MAGKVIVVVGGFFGSEAKGAVTGWLADSRKEEGGVVAVRVAGSNAGHTVVGREGDVWRLRHIPVAAVTNENAMLVLAAGSELDLDVLNDEINSLEAAGYPIKGRLYIDAQATVVDDTHKEQERSEALVEKIGSTGKGIGAARAARAMRVAGLYRSGGSNTADLLRYELRAGKTVIIEGTQGFGLGLHAGYYPKCTSSDCRAIDFLGMAGISPWSPEVSELEVWVVLRTYPIRVAGDSGELKNEIEWMKVGGIGVEPEQTTVTKKTRRVGEWDPALARRAILANGENVKVALMMLDYVFPELSGKKEIGGGSASTIRRYIIEKEKEIGTRIQIVGTGPSSVVERDDSGW